MGYLDKTTITVDAILTKKGRELLAKGSDQFQITQFALSDDEVDYSLWDVNHQLGSNYYGQAIESMPLVEAVPNETYVMKHKLVTLPRGTSKLPIVTVNLPKVTLTIGATANLNPTTLNFDGTNNSVESGGYRATIADRRLLANFVGRGAQNIGNQTVRPYTSTAVSETIVGQSFSMRAINSTTLFGTNTKLLTTITIEGIDSGASITVPVEISKEIIASVSAQGETGIVLR